MMGMGILRRPPQDGHDQDRARERLLAQERRVLALDRAVEVIRRDLPEEKPRAAR